MITNILLIVINILFICIFNKKIKPNNDYEKERNSFNKYKYKIILSVINILNILINISLIIEGFINNTTDIIYNILFATSFISFIIMLYIIKTRKMKYKLIDKKLINRFDILTILSAFIIPLSETIEKETNLKSIFIVIIFLILLTGITILILKLIKNKKYVGISKDPSDYIEDIRFTYKIELNQIINYIIYISFFVIFVYIRIPYAYILYILIALILILHTKKKIKKIANETDRIYKSITIAKEYPGIVYAFQFTRDLLLLKKLLIGISSYILSIIILYIVGELPFGIVALQLYILLLYVIISDKIYLLKYIKSISDEYIDKDEYKIKIKKKINYIETIKIFNIKLYRIIIEDNIIYKSNIILYDPELMIDEIEIRIDKSNMDDYITTESILYEE